MYECMKEATVDDFSSKCSQVRNYVICNVFEFMWVFRSTNKKCARKIFCVLE